jgi:hypothetical protein
VSGVERERERERGYNGRERGKEGDKKSGEAGQ